ncbi:MAG: DNA mismatch repair endonuclease MutL [Tissierellia bacterium]|nr:DNA mismatch repair endonuclease MutL [Tissierellia bacterium]
MNKIKILDNNTIQKIAAGEVIERPASVIKELMENSFDADAKSITVETLNGGKDLMKITDDGFGIQKADIALAFTPHATSKLSEIEDIYKISSYGFRGEALSSISSVSQIEIITKTENDELGTIAKIKENAIVEEKQIASPVGTSIKIENLFYNLPVREKLLKSNSAEDRAVADVVIRQALSNPEVSIKYYKDKDLFISSKATESVENRIYSLLGREFSDGLSFINNEYNNIRVYGGVSKTSLYRGNRSQQILFINNRSVFLPGVSKAIENYYKTIIPNGKFPCFVLYVEVPNGEVDVNIHPNKREVKLLDQDAIIRTILYGISKAKEDIDEVKSVNIFEKNTSPNIQTPIKMELGGIVYKDFTSNIVDELESFSLEDKRKLIQKSEIKDEDLFSKVIGFDNSTIIETNNNAPIVAEREKDFIINTKKEEFVKSNNNEVIPENMKVIGILFKTYILMEDEYNNAYIIDQHAAHERILYEEFKEQYEKKDVSRQTLIVPEIISLSSIDKEKIMQNTEKLLGLGFEIEDFGGENIAVRAVPMMFKLHENRQFLVNLVDSLDEINFQSDFYPEKIMKKACVNAIKAGDSINSISAMELLRKLLKCDNYKNCPHGRPTIIKLNKRDFELAFLRV